ncbi:hypothetical protein GCM10009795_039850 [Nocardioides hankookensis]|uniref:Uncharacterized protein n=1 Tax=Nocardioides hankookensis TaxID=443157 RepID=A0ABW1LPT2_9ACTN
MPFKIVGVDDNSHFPPRVETRLAADFVTKSESISLNDATVDSVLNDSATASQKSFLAQSQTNRIVNRMTVLPRQARVTLIKTLVKSLIDNGIWDKLDGFYMLAAHDEQAARLNWRGGPAQDLTSVNSPIFTTDRGFQGDGTTSYLTTSLSGTGADQYKQDDAFMGLWCITNASSNTGHGVSGAGNGYINPRSVAGAIVLRANSGSTLTFAGMTDSSGLTAWSRPDNANVTAYKNGSVFGTQSSASVALGTNNFEICRNQTNYSSRQIAFAAFGARLTDAQQAALYTAVRTYLLAVGATS